MNKKLILNIICLSLLTNCALLMEKPMDKEVLKENKISYTLEAYKEYFNKIFRDRWIGCYGEYKVYEKDEFGNTTYEYHPTKFVFLDERYRCSDKTSFNTNDISILLGEGYTALAEKNSLKCLFLKYNNEECVNYRNVNKGKTSKVYYFDYKRFLPKDSNIKTDDDFISLAEKYNNYEHENLTNEEIEEKLNYYIYDGIIKEKEENKKKIEQENKKSKSYTEDCKQAEEKAEEYKNAKSSEGLIDLTIGQVVDFAKNGVFLEFYTIYGKARIFVNTKDTEYATYEYFRPNGVYYKKNGYYKYTTVTGATNSVESYIPTKYKLEKSDYKYYLKNKKIKNCYKDRILYEENSEEKYVKREN